MGEQLAIAELGRAALERSRLEARDIAHARIRHPHAKNTERAYETARKQWCAYCDALGMPPAPIDPEELVLYLEQLTKNRKLAPNSVRVHLSALAELDKCARITPVNPFPQSIREHIAVQRWEESWNRDNPRVPRRRAAALEHSDLERLIAIAAEPRPHTDRAGHVLRYTRDRCLLLFGVHGAMRANDLAKLELGQVAQLERGIQVRFATSKADQAGIGESVGLMAQGRRVLCPVDAFMQWRKLRGDAPGPLFVGVSRSAELELGKRLTERHITRIVSEYAKRAGLTLNVSAHSLRATLATRASERGKNAAKIMQHMRCRSAHVFSTYVRDGELFNDNVSAGLFD